MEAYENDISVCFTGHRHLAEKELPAIRSALKDRIRLLYRDGYRVFFNGAAIGFDMEAAEAVLDLKAELPDLKLIIVRPCGDQDKNWPAADQERHGAILSRADEVRTLLPVYQEGCMLSRDRYMVEHSSACVCWMTGFRGGTAYTVRYALKNNLLLYNLAVQVRC